MTDANDASRHAPALYITDQPRNRVRPILAVVLVVQVRTQYDRPRLRRRRRAVVIATMAATRAELCHAREQRRVDPVRKSIGTDEVERQLSHPQLAGEASVWF